MSYHHNQATTLLCKLQIFFFTKRKPTEASLQGLLKRRNRGSITVEAAGVCSLSILILGSFLLLFIVLQQEFALRQTMYQAQETACVGGMWNRDKIEPILMTHSYICGKENKLTNPVFYVTEKEGYYLYEGTVTIPLLSGNRTDKYKIRHQMKIYGFNGYTAEANGKTQYVYLTAYGRVYHVSLNCSHLDLNISSVAYQEIDKYRNSSGSKYYPCELCGGKGGEGICYITSYGTRYHNSMDCSGLLRNIRKVPITEVGDRKACSSCGQ